MVIKPRGEGTSAPPPPQKKKLRSFSWALFVKERILHFKLDDTLF